MTTYTGTGNADTIYGTSTSDTIYGLGGNDTLSGEDGSDTIYGGDGDDVIYGKASLTDSYVDYLNGDNGNDKIFMSIGDQVNGGAGTDTLYAYFMNSGTGITANFSNVWTGGTFSIGTATVTGMESLYVVYGSTANDNLTLGSIAGSSPQAYGWTGADTITGGAGNDQLFGFSTTNGDTDADTLYGMGGDDMIYGGVNDYMDGGSGTDTLFLDLSAGTTAANADFTLLLAGYTGSIFGATLISFEHIGLVTGTAYDDTIDASADNYATQLEGGAGNDTLVAGSGDNILRGGTGDDTMTGGAGNDTYLVDSIGDVVNELSGGGDDLVNATISYTLGSEVERLTLGGTAALNGTGNTLANVLTGNSGANVLSGLDGNDTLLGADGADTLIGGIGRDTMTGGTGADIFRFNTGDFSGTTASTADRITDFSHAQLDKIDLSNIDAIPGGTDDAFSFLGTGAFTGVAGQLRYVYSGTDTMVYGDTDGDGVADFAFVLTGNVALVSGDFIL